MAALLGVPASTLGYYDKEEKIKVCLRHTTGFDYLFAKLPEKPTIQQEPEWKDTLPVFGASKVPEREGHGYEYPASFNTSNVGSWLTNLVRGL